MLEFVDSDLYFVQDRNNFINPLLQVGSGSGSESGSVEKSTESRSGGPKITGSDRIRIWILIPEEIYIDSERKERRKRERERKERYKAK